MAKLNVLLAGEEAAGIMMFRKLLATDHRLVAVLTTPAGASARGASLWSVATSAGIRTLPAKLVKDPAFADVIRSEQVDVLLNVHSLHIITEPVLRAPRLGAFNLHPGPLPRYAGLNGVSWAIYRGERVYGVTVHQMVPALDAGPIAEQALFPIEDSDTALSLATKCVRVGIPLMEKLLNKLSAADGAVNWTAQDPQLREVFGRNVPDAARVVWTRNATDIVNLVRACDYYPLPSPWGCARATRGDLVVGIVKATRTGERTDALPGMVGGPSGPSVRIACADEWVNVSKIHFENHFTDASTVLTAGQRLADGPLN